MASKGISIGSSGLDIDQLVTDSLSKYQSKYNKAYKAKVTTEWTKTAYTDLYSSMYSFRYGTASDYKLSANTTARTATSTLAAVTAIPNGDATEMTHDVSVSQLATSAFLQTANGSKVSKTLGDGTKSINLLDVAGITLTGAENNADIALSFSVNDGVTTRKISYTYLQLKGGTDAAGKTVKAKTLNDLGSDLKAPVVKKPGETSETETPDLNVSLNYDAVNDSMSIYNSKSGTANKIQITVDADTAGANATSLFNNFGLASYDSATKTLTALTGTALYDGTIAGKDSKFIIDGKSYTKDSNTVSINNVSYTLKDKTATGETAKVSISTDTTALVDKVQKFVDGYNDMLSKLNTQLHATKYSAYGALTETEKEDMSDTQLEKWEEKAKSGLLRNDKILSNIVNNMRTAISEKVEGISGKYTSLSSIGITTGDYTQYGKISLDTTKLKEAIAADPDCVNKLFTTKGTDDKGKYSEEKSGIAYRLSEISSAGLDSISEQAGTSGATSDQSYLGVKITSMAANLTILQQQLDAKETYYYKKYNAMETAISNLTSSISSLSSMLG